MDECITKWLYDASQAATLIQGFTKGKVFADYRSNPLLSSAVERQFEILGEALKRIRDRDETVIQPIDGCRGAISFRNILAHGYDSVDDELVWSIIQDDLPELLAGIDRIQGG